MEPNPTLNQKDFIEFKLKVEPIIWDIIKSADFGLDILPETQNIYLVKFVCKRLFEENKDNPAIFLENLNEGRDQIIRLIKIGIYNYPV